MASNSVRFVVVSALLLLPALVAAQQPSPVSLEEHLRGSAVAKTVIDTFLDPQELHWAQFDPDLGYILGNYFPQDGIDGSSTISTVQKTGARTPHNYTHKKGRINTYGNSFTQCHQVSDGETWQEYLAAHLGEPIRNFGMGGYGVYQAYRRMVREEQTDKGAEYVVLYIWGDDHLRSLMRCRHAVIYKWWDVKGGRLFHNNFWAHVEMDLDTGAIVERPNRLPTPESLYRMTDPEWMYQNLKDDLATQMFLFVRGAVHDIDRPGMQRLAGHLGVSGFSAEQAGRQEVQLLLNKYGYAATRYILQKAREFTQQNKKKLLIVLNDPRSLGGMVESGLRPDQEIVDFLREKNFLYFDMNPVHVEDFKKFSIPFGDYLKRYFIPHYNPTGNHFFAYSIKDTIVQWLEPKPITYRPSAEAMVDFEGYVEQ